MKIDETGKVAHYTRLEHLANILHDRKIKIGKIKNMNDPRESSLDWINTGGVGNINPEEENKAKELKASVGEKLRMLCTTCIDETRSKEYCKIESSIYGHPRMWAQYADNSKGFCVILDIDTLNKEIESARPSYKKYEKVEYHEWLPAIGGYVNIEYGDMIDLSKVNLLDVINENNMLHSVYFKKSIDWKDESEYRWLFFSEQRDDIFISIEKAISAVVLGVNFPKNQLSQVKSYCKDLCSCYMLEYQHPKYKLNDLYLINN